MRKFAQLYPSSRSGFRHGKCNRRCDAPGLHRSLYSMSNTLDTARSARGLSAGPFTQFSAKDLDGASAIWFMQNPTKVDPLSVISQLPKLPRQRTSNLTTAIFFVTPSIASWFNSEHEFLKLAMNHIYSSLSRKHSPTSVVGVIDALPNPKACYVRHGWTDTKGYESEGLALCLLPHRLSESLMTTSKSNDDLPLVRFHSLPMSINSGFRTMVSTTLPVANTLFVNGSKSTLLRQKWITSLESTAKHTVWQPNGATEAISRLDIPVPMTPKSYATCVPPIEPLTKPRKVVSSMGNVLRELEGDDSNPIKASMELEIHVPEFLKTKERIFGPGQVLVYALIMPSKAQPQTSDALRSTGSTQKPPHIPQVIKNALWSGGRLHKVTGGGGGWGKKAGLLSIDPTTSFANSSEFQISMFPDFDGESSNNGSVPAKEAIPVDSSVQFWATYVSPKQSGFLDSPHPVENTPSREEERWSRIKTILVGTCSSTDGNLDQESHEKLPPKVSRVTRAFGMLSHSGVCLSLESVEEAHPESDVSPSNFSVSHQFRLDVPSTAIRSRIRKPPMSDLVEFKDHADLESELNSQANELGSIVRNAIETAKVNKIRKQLYYGHEKFHIPKGRLKTKGKSSSSEKYPPPIRKHYAGPQD